MKVILVLAITLLSACSVIQPKVDECMAYESAIESSYCYVSKEVTAVINATAQSRRDGVITVDQAADVAKAMRKADEYLDLAEKYIILGDDLKATESLEAAKLLLLEVK